jgi:hypothetical protein
VVVLSARLVLQPVLLLLLLLVVVVVVMLLLVLAAVVAGSCTCPGIHKPEVLQLRAAAGTVAVSGV